MLNYTKNFRIQNEPTKIYSLEDKFKKINKNQCIIRCFQNCISFMNEYIDTLHIKIRSYNNYFINDSSMR